MPALTNLETIWSTLTEVDTLAIREQVQTPFRLALLGSDAAAVQWLYEALGANPFAGAPQSLHQVVWTYQLPASADVIASAAHFDLAIIVLPADCGDCQQEREAYQALRQASFAPPILVVRVRKGEPFSASYERWPGISIIPLDPVAPDPFADQFVPRLLKLLPEKHVALGHHLPGLRRPLARRLVKETSIANAGYAASAGVAELIPFLLIPLNVADVFVLTKNQALMAYKLALLLGQDIGVQEMSVELAGVLGTGFVWRELAHFLVGLAPGIGLVPKIAVAYAGTYVIGEAVLAWYAYRRKLTPQQMKAMFAEALTEGKARAAALAAKNGTRRSLPALPRPSLPRLRRQPRRCPKCQARVGRKAHFCPHCGQDLTQTPLLETTAQAASAATESLPSS